ncbi:MAG: tRNA lysidine(34) synthetase TilS [Ruminococcaceae bacterium]|nr:tRNA lysidine(34) synthetase TilS [Oscillospiraceae bacterium]
MRRPDSFRDPRALAGMAPDTPLCIALSGGADSVALLTMLSEDPHLSAVHVHHGIRGAEADRDADFCRALAKKHGIPLTVLRIDAPALAKARGVSLETAARDGRYEAILSHLRQNGIPLLATAHHADDQLETLLQHLLRGSGLRGLGGIPACRPLGEGIFVVRPLLLLTKKELLAHLADCAQDFVCDSTNEEGCCTRNRLRLEVTPVLEELYPGASAAAARCAEALREDERYLEQLADEFLQSEGREPLLASLAALPRPLFLRVMRQLLPTDPAWVHIDALAAFCQKATPHATLSLPGVTVAAENSRLCLLREAAPVSDYEILLRPGENPLPCGGKVLLCEKSDTPPASICHTFVVRLPLCSANIKGALRARNMRAGDKIRSGGVHRAVRRMSGPAVPSATRARMPLIVDDAGIVATPFGQNHNIRDDVFQKDGTDLVVYLLFD